MEPPKKVSLLGTVTHRDSFKRDESHTKSNKKTELSSQYDIVLVFPLEGPKEALTQSAEAKYVVNELHKASMETFSYLSIQDDELIVLVRCPVEKLKTFADTIDFNLELDPDAIKRLLKEGLKDPESGKGNNI